MTDTTTLPDSATDVSVPPPAAEPAKDGTSTPEAAPDKENPDTPKKRPASERISELYAQKKAAERRADEAVRVAQGLREQLQRPSTIDPNDFAAQETDRFRQAVKAERYEQTIEEARTAHHAKIASNQELFKAKVDAARERIPDLDATLSIIQRLPLSDDVCELIAESDHGVEVAYYLAKNRGEADRLSQLPPHQQGAEIARIEARVQSAPTARRTSNAPPPPPMINGSPAPAGRKDPSDMSMEEYASFYADRRKAKR